MSTDKNLTPRRTEEMDADVSPAERALLDESIEDSMLEGENLNRSSLDETDADGEALNVESSGATGEDLDIPGAELDDDNELLGEEDEENNGYSEADTE